jgi:hypothetical protein
MDNTKLIDTELFGFGPDYCAHWMYSPALKQVYLLNRITGDKSMITMYASYSGEANTVMTEDVMTYDSGQPDGDLITVTPGETMYFYHVLESSLLHREGLESDQVHLYDPDFSAVGVNSYVIANRVTLRFNADFSKTYAFNFICEGLQNKEQTDTTNLNLVMITGDEVLGVPDGM